MTATKPGVIRDEPEVAAKEISMLRAKRAGNWGLIRPLAPPVRIVDDVLALPVASRRPVEWKPDERLPVAPW
jgi:hypothetical protein